MKRKKREKLNVSLSKSKKKKKMSNNVLFKEKNLFLWKFYVSNQFSSLFSVYGAVFGHF